MHGVHELGHRPRVLDVRFPDGTTARLPVTAVREDAPAAVVLPRALVRQHDPGALTAAVRLDGPAVPATGLRVLTARDYVQLEIDEEGRIVDLFLAVLLALGVGYTGLAVANTLLLASTARRGEFRALRLAGGGTSHVLRVTSGEALLAAGTGTLLGGTVALLCLLAVRRTLEEGIGQPVALVVPWGRARRWRSCAPWSPYWPRVYRCCGPGLGPDEERRNRG